MLQRKEIGLHESLRPFQQNREITMVALIVDPAGRCLLVDGLLPEEEHVCKGDCAHEGVLPFIGRLVEPVYHLRVRRIYQLARLYQPHPEQANSPLYVVVRVDVKDSIAVPGGEWVATAERAVSVANGNLTPLNCIRAHLGNDLAWQMPDDKLFA